MTSLPCRTPADLLALGRPLPRVARRLAQHAPITIVAFGSSSTEGHGASSPDRAYPARLEAELRRHQPANAITVLNRGVGGQDAREMLERYERDVAAAAPDLVLWQVGTNALVLERALAETEALVCDGLRRMRAAGYDVILLDPQYCPAVLDSADLQPLIQLLARLARQHEVALFRRFEIMRRWHEQDGMPIEASIIDDGLHMNDFSYGCIAELLAEAILEAAGDPAAPV